MGFWNGQNTTGGSVGGDTQARGPPGVGLKLTANGNYDLENKRLTNVADATGQDDAVPVPGYVSSLTVSAREVLVENIVELVSLFDEYDEPEESSEEEN